VVDCVERRGAPRRFAEGEKLMERSGDSARYGTIDFEDRMATAEFKVSERAHITVDSSVCEGCSTRGCLVACPAKLFVPTAGGGILFNYEQCFECGTCYLVCNREGAITWTYPEGGFGVEFRAS
jgi:ferredoxin like protein